MCFYYLIYYFALQKRKNLKVIVSSATVNAEELCDFFNSNTKKNSAKDTATILSVEGRLYPVDIFYVEGMIYFFFLLLFNLTFKYN